MKTPRRIRFLLWILLTLPGWAVSAQDDTPPKSSIFQWVRGDLEKKKIILRKPPEGLKPWTGEQDQEEAQGQEKVPPEAMPPPPPVRRYGQFVTPRASQLPATDRLGQAASGLRVVTTEAGDVITAYPIPWP